MSDLEAQFKMKQNDWLKVCQDLDVVLQHWSSIRYALSKVIRDTTIDGDVQQRARDAYTAIERIVKS